MAETFALSKQCDDIYKFVAGRAARLQGAYLSDLSRSQAAKQLALLRRSIGKEPGASPDVWPLEFEDLPDSLTGRGRYPSAGERAVHIALTLFAVHQQSQKQGMHQVGKDFDIGASARKCVHATGGPENGELPRHLAAMVSSDSIDELAHYARQQIKILKAHSIPIDYGRFARQLLLFQIPYARDGVLLEWGRGFARRVDTEL